MARSLRRALRALLALALALTGIGAMGGASPAAAAPTAPTGTLDMVLLLDGSGSISDADWDLQLQGYAAALRDRTNVPTDGSVAVSVIQWSYDGPGRQNTRVEVPLTVLDSAAAVEGVVAKVLAIRQMNNTTNPGDAIVAAAAELSAHGRTGAGSALCMSTDGTLNDGVSLSSATSTAKTAGVDKLSVIAIEDGSFNEARARSAYGPHVFGGGQVTVARTTAEFTTMIAGCAADPLQLVALEVTQGLQDLDNTVPVVSTRETLVRAYLATIDDSTVRATARLHVTRNGAPIPGSPFTPQFAYNPTPVRGVVVDDEVEPDQKNLDQTLNFRIPAAQATGTWDLRLEYAGGLRCTQEDADPSCSERVTFVDGVDLDVAMVGIGAQATGSARVQREALAEQARRVQAMLPASTFRTRQQWLQVRRLPTSGAGIRSVNESLTTARLMDRVPVQQRWYGLIPGVAGKDGVAGMNSGFVAAGFEGNSSGERDMGVYRSNAVHELMHSYGVHHSVNAAQNGYDKNLLGQRRYKKGWCGEIASLDAPEWPYWHDDRAAVRANTGPYDYQHFRSRTFGTDVRFVGTRFPLALLSPTNTVSVMSYCQPQDPTTWPDWIGVPDWNQMLNDDLLPIGVDALPTPPATPRPGPTPIVFRALFDANGAATVLPSVPLDQEPTADDPAGTHTLVMLDADGAQVHAVRFTPLEEQNDALPGTTVGLPGAGASVVLPAPEGVASIELRAGDQVLATVPVTANAPEVSVDVPRTGTRDEVTITWSATDADGDPLAHAVRYSADDGETWQTIGMDLEGGSTSVPRWALAGSDAARLQVISSDGVNTGVATSAAFSMPNLAPEVAVSTPEDGTVVSGAQTVVFSASAIDAEDGDLSAGLVWSSDLDGQLGTGATLTRRADELSEGTHQITVTSTDAAGATSSAMVELVVYRIAPVAPEPDPVTEQPTTTPVPPADGQGGPDSASPAPAAPAAPPAPAGRTGDGLAWTGWTPLPWCIGAAVLVGLGALLVWGRSRARRAAQA